MANWKKIGYWILILFAVYLVIELLRKLLGGSLGFEELVIGLLLANLGYSFYINTQLSEHLGWHKGQEANVKKGDDRTPALILAEKVRNAKDATKHASEDIIREWRDKRK